MLDYPSVRRGIDVALAPVLLLFLAPVMGVTAVAIWMEDGFPILFRQTRIGQNGRPFVLFKFRSLTKNAGYTARPASHVTRTGAILRRWALDELPQLWNVLRGDMSLIGPRPVLPKEADAYDERMARRLTVPPGLTGWAQIHGRNKLDWTQRIEHDLWYVDNRSPAVDLRILLRTPVTLFAQEGIYGPGNQDPSSAEVQAHSTEKNSTVRP